MVPNRGTPAVLRAYKLLRLGVGAADMNYCSESEVKVTLLIPAIANELRTSMVR